jgi:hypothetical protein
MGKFNTKVWAVTAASISMVVVAPVTTAGSKTLEILGVSNNNIVCGGGPLENCIFDSIDKVQCPADQEPQSVTVTVGPGQMQTCVNATNTAAFSSCYNIQTVTHNELQLVVDNGGLNLTLADGPAPPLGTGGSGTTIAALGGCQVGFPETTFTYRRPSGGNINTCTILESNVQPPIVQNYTPADPEWGTFFGPGTVPLRFAAQAVSSVEQSGTWDGGVETDARATVTITANCTPEEDEKPVPAIGPAGVGALIIALSGIGLLAGFRRRQ